MISEGTKRCNKCRRSKPLSEYYADSTTSSGRQARCIACQRATRASYRSELRRNDPTDYRARRTAERYGVSKEDILAFWAVPNCQSCGEPLTDKTQRIDHCHEFGHVRGVICHPCNVAMAGPHNECLHRLHSAISYLRRDAERRHEQG